MKGIILAAGRGTRMYPMTLPIAKPLLPVCDKPMIYYPLSTLLQAGIGEILVIVPPGDRAPFEALLGDGGDFGASISYLEQPVQRGIADAFLIGADFVGRDRVCLALGDNLFYGGDFSAALERAIRAEAPAAIFGYRVEDPRPFGVVEFDAQGRAVSIEEKPEAPKSDYIVPGLYLYDNSVLEIARGVAPSARGELEITSVNNAYLQRGTLQVFPFGEGTRWFDTGNAQSLLAAANAVNDEQIRTGALIGCPHEAAYRAGRVGRDALRRQGETLSMTQYGQYLLRLAQEAP